MPSSLTSSADQTVSNPQYGSLLSTFQNTSRSSSGSRVANSGTVIASSSNRVSNSYAAQAPGSSEISSRTGATTVPPTGTVASIGSGAVVVAGDSIIVHAEEDIEFDVLVGSAAIGAVGIGGSIAIATFESNVEAFVDIYAELTAGTDITDYISIKAIFNENLDGLSFAGQGGLAGLGAQVVIFNDRSSQRAHVNDNVQLKQAGDRVEIIAIANRVIEADSIGVSVGVLAAGATISIGEVAPSSASKAGIEAVTSATIGDNVTVGGTLEVQDLVLQADSTISIITDTIGVGAGAALSGAGAVSKSIIEPLVLVSIGSGANIQVTRDLDLLSQSTADADAEALGVSVGGGASVGISLAEASITGTVKAVIGASAAMISAGRDIRVRALQNVDEAGAGNLNKKARAEGNASGGSLGLAGNGVDAEATASPNVEAGIDSDLTTIDGDIIISAVANNIAVVDESPSITIGLTLAVGAVIEEATASGTTQARFGGSQINGNGDLSIESINLSRADARAMAAGGGLISGAGADATSTTSPFVTSYISPNATISVSGDVNILASAEIGSRAEALGISGGALAVGASLSDATASPIVHAGLGDPIYSAAQTATSGNIEVKAANLTISSVTTILATNGNGYAAYAKSNGSAGALIGVTATDSEVTNNSHVRSYVGDSSSLTIAGNTTVSAVNNTKQKAEADANVGGVIAVGVVDASASSNTITESYLGTMVNLTGSSLEISAIGHDDTFAETSAGSGGVVAGSAAISETSNASVTRAIIKDDSVINLTTDWDLDGIIDAADIQARDFNNNGIPDDVDAAYVAGTDADGDFIIDRFDYDVLGRATQTIGTDVNLNGIQDALETRYLDANDNFIPDRFDTAYVSGTDSDSDGIVDTYDFEVAGRFIAGGRSTTVGLDVNQNGVQDAYEASSLLDADNDGITDVADASVNLITLGTDSDNDGIIDEFDPDSGFSQANLLGSLTMTADHTAIFNSKSKSTSGGLLSGAGADLDNTVNSIVSVIVGDRVDVIARKALLDAINRVNKPDLGTDGNLKGTTGGLISGAGADSDTTINLTTVVEIGDDSRIEIISDQDATGLFVLRANNFIFARDKSTFAYRWSARRCRCL